MNLCSFHPDHPYNDASKTISKRGEAKITDAYSVNSCQLAMALGHSVQILVVPEFAVASSSLRNSCSLELCMVLMAMIFPTLV